jgi:hypothetical protein
VYFDPDADETWPMSAVKFEADVVEAMPKAGTSPLIIYAYKKTGGLLLLKIIHDHWSPDRVKDCPLSRCHCATTASRPIAGSAGTQAPHLGRERASAQR